MRDLTSQLCFYQLRVCSTVAFIVLACGWMHAASESWAAESAAPKLDARVQAIPRAPLHGVPVDGGILSVNSTRLVTVGTNYFAGNCYLTVTQLPSGEEINNVVIALPIENREHATGSRDGSRIAILQGDNIEIRDVVKLGEVRLRVPATAGSSCRIALSNDGGQLAVGSYAGIAVYDCVTGKRLHQFKTESELPTVFYNDADQLGAYDKTGVWLAASNSKPPELLLKTPKGFEMQSVCVSNEHCFASIAKSRSEDLVRELLSGTFEFATNVILKFDTQGNVKWKVAASDDSMAVRDNTVVFRNEDLLMQATGPAEPTIIGRCEWLSQLKFSAGKEMLVGSNNKKNGVQVWNAKTWEPHLANAIPFTPSASGIDDSGRATVTSQSSVCAADLGQPFRRVIDLPKDISPYSGKHWLSGDGRLLAWLTRSGGVKCMDLVENQAIKIETRDDLKVSNVWLNQSGNRAIVRYQRAATSPGKAAQRGFFEGFFGASSASSAPTDLITLPTGERIGHFDTGDLGFRRHVVFPGERIAYSTESSIAHFIIKPTDVNGLGGFGTGVNQTGSIRIKNLSQAISESGSMVVGTWEGNVLWYETPTSQPQTLLGTSDDRKRTVGISPDGQIAFSCEFRFDQRQALVKAIRCRDAKILWEQWLPGSVEKLQVSPKGKYLLLSMEDGWLVVHADF